MPQSDDLISSGEAAAMIGVSPRQVVRFANAGVLTAAFRGHGVTGAFVFLRSDVAAFVAQRSRGAA